MLTAFIGIMVKRPFTLYYAKFSVDEVQWDHNPEYRAAVISGQFVDGDARCSAVAQDSHDHRLGPHVGYCADHRESVRLAWGFQRRPNRLSLGRAAFPLRFHNGET